MNVPDPLLPKTVRFHHDGTALELVACPFCGGVELEVETDRGAAWEAGGGAVELAWIVCDDCGASGPVGDSVAETAAAWNDRMAMPTMTDN